MMCSRMIYRIIQDNNEEVSAKPEYDHDRKDTE